MHWELSAQNLKKPDILLIMEYYLFLRQNNGDGCIALLINDKSLF